MSIHSTREMLLRPTSGQRGVHIWLRPTANLVLFAIGILAFFGATCSLQGFPVPRNLAVQEKDVEKILGTWQLVYVEKSDGNILDKKPGEVTWTFTANELTAVTRKANSENNETTTYLRKYCLHRFQGGIGQLDIQDEKASSNAISHWIYDLRGDCLEISIGDGNGMDANGKPISVRPRGFSGPQQYTALFNRVHE